MILEYAIEQDKAFRMNHSALNAMPMIWTHIGSSEPHTPRVGHLLCRLTSSSCVVPSIRPAFGRLRTQCLGIVNSPEPLCRCWTSHGMSPQNRKRESLSSSDSAFCTLDTLMYFCSTLMHFMEQLHKPNAVTTRFEMREEMRMSTSWELSECIAPNDSWWCG